MGRGEDHGRCHSPKPSSSAKRIGTIDSQLQPRKSKLRPWAEKIIPAGTREGEELRRDLGTNDVPPPILRSRCTAAIAEKPRRRIHRARGQGLTEDVAIQSFSSHRCAATTSSANQKSLWAFEKTRAAEARDVALSPLRPCRSSTARRRRLALLVRGASPFSAYLTSPIHFSAVSRNSGIKMSYDEQKLRERAYELWMQGGGKEGRSDQYWFQAEREICSDRANPPQLAPSQPLSDAPRGPKRSVAGTKSKAGQNSPMRGH